jgi:hypothetical protein
MYLRFNRPHENCFETTLTRETHPEPKESSQFITHNLNQFYFTCFFLVQHFVQCDDDDDSVDSVGWCVSQVHHKTGSRNLLKRISFHFIFLPPHIILNTSLNTFLLHLLLLLPIDPPNSSSSSSISFNRSLSLLSQ